MSARARAWVWQDGEDSVTATWRLGGWPRPANNEDGRTAPCRMQCGRPAEWKIERRAGQNVDTACYCIRDLPSTEAPPTDAEERP